MEYLFTFTELSTVLSTMLIIINMLTHKSF